MRKLVAPVAGAIEEVLRKWGKKVFYQNFTLPYGAPHRFLALEGTTVPAIILAITSDQQVIAVRQFRYGANAFVLELPGGCPDREGEPPEETLRKELRQETGYEPGKVVEVGGLMWFEPASVRARYRAFLATGCHYVGEPEPDEAEVMQVELYPLQAWVVMIGDGTLKDDKTIAVTTRGLFHLGWKFGLAAPSPAA